MDQAYEKPHPPQYADRIIDRAVEHRHVICRGLSSMTLWWRRYGGGREVEGRLLGLAMIFGWAFFTHDMFCLLYFGASIIGMVLYAATTSRRNQSLWEGWPYLMSLIPSYRVAEFLEIFVVAGAGYVTLHLAPFLGMLILASSSGLWINFLTDWWTRRKETISYHDAQHEMANRRAAYKRWR